ncbi:unnamed protein product [Mytilus coruscus]|uniref:DUF6589 domain-containing protein n=1 Tax=Mytilus coruscus TaxID=42192 RepID=A0A6J8D1M3_MYTCO|nr:unnamed protein product [Mytilus coruscus]
MVVCHRKPRCSKKSELDNIKSNLQLLFENPIDFRQIRNTVICDHCLNIVKTFKNIKERLTHAILNSVNVNNEPIINDELIKTPTQHVKNSKKRLASTPASELRFRLTPKREPVISSLVRSFEKLNTHSLNVKERSGVSRRRIDFDNGHDHDHSYTKDSPSCDIRQISDQDSNLIEALLCQNMDSEYDSICKEISKPLSELGNTKSLLLKNDIGRLQNSDMFSACILEMNTHCPALLQLLNRLHSIHLTLSESSKRNIIREFGEQLEEKLIRDVSDGKNGKLNGDNLDIRVNTNDVRMNNKNKDYHFFATNFVLNRISTERQPIVHHDSHEPSLEIFLPNETETLVYKNSLKILLGRILVEYMPGFQWMKKVLPDHIDHPHREEMKRKSVVHMLPLSLNNECSYDGCVRIMDEYIEMINRWYRKAGRAAELDTLQIPVGGDQLTRVRFQGAKTLRAGAHTKQERFDQLYPMVIELFHTLQDFLEKLCKRFLKLGNSRDQGTLANLKILIQRSNVNGKVKSRFKVCEDTVQAHEDFVLTVGHSYFLDYAMKKFDMKDLDDTPTHKLLPENIKQLHAPSKQKIFDAIMEEVIADIYIPYETQAPKKMDLKLLIANQAYQCSASLDNNTAVVPLLINESEKGQDDLFNYVHNFLQWYFIILQIQDAIHEGDMVRTNVIIKTMIPFFFSHSVLSKYFTECIDFILKTEFTLPPHVAAEVRAASFVNIHGGIGKNKAADMHKENEVKLVKDLIKGLGANKTEKSIIAMSKAAPVINDVTTNFDKMLKLNEFKTKHKKRSSEEDIGTLVKKLKDLDLWNFHENRALTLFSGISQSPFNFDTDVLQRDLPCEADDDNNHDDDDDDDDNEQSDLED